MKLNDKYVNRTFALKLDEIVIYVLTVFEELVKLQ